MGVLVPALRAFQLFRRISRISRTFADGAFCVEIISMRGYVLGQKGPESLTGPLKTSDYSVKTIIGPASSSYDAPCEIGTKSAE